MTLMIVMMIAQRHTGQFQQMSQALSTEQLAFAFRVQDPSVDLLSNCRRLSKSKNVVERQFGQFLQGRVYQRQYELALNSLNPLKKDWLDNNAMAPYHSYIDKYKQPNPYLSDVRFYKAIGYLELDKVKLALQCLRDMDPKLDNSIYIDEIIWTPRKDFSLRRGFDANSLRNALSASIRAHSDTQFPDVRLESIAQDIRVWAAEQRSSS